MPLHNHIGTKLMVQERKGINELNSLHKGLETLK